MKPDESKFSNKEITHLLRSVAAAYLLKNDNIFKIIAYQKAADTVEHLSRELKDIWHEGELKGIPGIGPSISSHLDEYFKKGRSSHFNKVLSGIPETVFELMKIPTLGAKRAYRLVEALNLKNKKTLHEDLKKACRDNKVAEIPTFGEKSQAEILKAIDLYYSKTIKQERMVLPYAFVIATDIINYLKKNPEVKQVDVLGSLRRMAATIGDIDISVVVKTSPFVPIESGLRRDKQNLKVKTNIKDIINYFINYPKVIKVLNAGEKKASILITGNRQIDLRIQEEKNYGSMLQYFTGSKAHNIKLREYALKKGYSLSEYGIKKIQKSKINPPAGGQNYNSKLKIFEFDNEPDFYSFLNLQYIPSEIREGTNEIELAQKYQLPKLVELKDIKGDLHLHSSYNIKSSHDLGHNSYEEILLKAKNLNYEYVGFSEHNPKFAGLSETEINSIMKRRKDYIDKVFSIKKFKQSKYFIGIEADILPNDKIALTKESIKYLDYIIVAVHSVFNMEIKEMTQRVLSALKYPKVRVLGHPTGRYFNERDGFELEWEKIFEVCKKNNIALEINAWPNRLDLPDILVREAVRAGVKLIINTDAHQNKEMDDMFYGVAVARRGWCQKSDIINTLDYVKFKDWIDKSY